MTTVTLNEFRQNFSAVEQAARRGPVKITRCGRVVGSFTAANKAGKWTPPDFAARAIKTHNGTVNMLDYLDR